MHTLKLRIDIGRVTAIGPGKTEALAAEGIASIARHLRRPEDPA